VPAFGHPPWMATQRILVPAYFTPSSGKWQTACNAVSKERATATFIMNPDNGPGAAEDGNYRLAIDHCQARGHSVVGYVTTDHANRAMNEVTADVDEYYSFYPGIRGIFFDEMSNNVSHRDYYRALYMHVKSKSATARIVGNPGIPASTAWQVIAPVVADVIVVFEGPFVRRDSNDPATAYRDWRPPSWVTSRPSGLFAHLVYESPSPARTRAICLESFRTKNAGWIFVTQDTRPNPWDSPLDAALLSSQTLERRQVLAVV